MRCVRSLWLEEKALLAEWSRDHCGPVGGQRRDTPHRHSTRTICPGHGKTTFRLAFHIHCNSRDRETLTFALRSDAFSRRCGSTRLGV